MRSIALAVMFGLLAPGTADAQRRPACCNGNPFSFSPYVGVYKDAYDAEADDSDLGWMIGFKAGYEATRRATLLANLGYMEANDVATHVLAAPIRDNQWVVLTGGLDYVLIPGATTISVGGEAGVSWRKTPLSNNTGNNFGNESWASYETLIPSLTLRHHFSPRSSMSVSLRDHILDVLEGPTQHSLALTLGLSFR